MKLPLILVSLAGACLGACYPHIDIASTTLPNGKHAIIIDCEVPSSQCQEEVSSLCPFGFTVVSSSEYISFDPGSFPCIWGSAAIKKHHERITIVCSPMPKELAQ